jgi:hypothetical protein
VIPAPLAETVPDSFRLGASLGKVDAPQHHLGFPLLLLVVCETARRRRNFRNAAWTLPMLTATLERALAGPMTGGVTVWSRHGVPAAMRHADRFPASTAE